MYQTQYNQTIRKSSVIQTLIVALCCTVDCQSYFQNDQTTKIVQNSLGWHDWADDDEVGDRAA